MTNNQKRKLLLVLHDAEKIEDIITKRFKEVCPTKEDINPNKIMSFKIYEFAEFITNLISSINDVESDKILMDELLETIDNIESFQIKKQYNN